MSDAQTAPWDAAEFLGTEEQVQDYAELIAADGDISEMRNAVATLARALGMTEIARRAGLQRRELYAALWGEEDATPETIALALRSLAEAPSQAADAA